MSLDPSGKAFHDDGAGTTHDIIPTPLPAGLPLMLSVLGGFLGLGFLRRRTGA